MKTILKSICILMLFSFLISNEAYCQIKVFDNNYVGINYTTTPSSRFVLNSAGSSAETIWPMSDDDKGVWLPKETADKLTDDQIDKWFLNRFLIDYGNSYEYTVTRGEVEIRKFRKNVKV